MRNFSKKLFLTVLILGLFLPVFSAHALTLNPFSIGDFTYKAVANIFGYSAYLIFSAVGTFMGLAVQILAWVVNIRIYTNVPVIQEGWKIMRDLANMFFIIALVVMAYGTIFKIQGYDFRSLIPKFLMAALLINFSLVIGGLIIDGTQILNNTFLTAMGDISGRLGQGLEPWNLLPDAASAQDKAEAIADLTFSSFTTMIFAIFLAFTFLISVSVPLVVAFVRIPILWALLIVSPAAWLLNILPATQQVYKNWWHQFLAWNLFLPYYLFFMYLALYFLSKKNEVIAGLGQTFVNDKLTGLTGLQSDFTFGLLFYYIMIAIFLISGTKVAMNAGRFSGTGIVSVAKWGRGVAMRRFGVTAAQKAAEQKLAQVKEEGLPGRFGLLYGGEYGLKQQTGRFAKGFGVRGAEISNQKAFVERAGKDYQDVERQYQNGKISEAEVLAMTKRYNATDPKGYAYRKLAAKIGQLNPDLFTSTLHELSNNPLAAEDFAKTAAGAKFSKMKGSDLAKMAAAESGPGYDYSFLQKNVAARREMFRYVMTDKKAMSGLNDDQIKAGIKSFGGHTTADAKAFTKEIGKVNPDYIVRYNLDSAISGDSNLRITAEEGFDKLYGNEIRNTTGQDISDYKINQPNEYAFQLKTHMYSSYLKSGDIKDTASIKVDTWRVNEFKEAMKTYIKQLRDSGGRGGARRSYINRLERELINTPNGDEKIRILFSEILDPTTYSGGTTPPTGLPPVSPTGLIP